MNVLTVYYTQTGNTAQVARAIHEAVSSQGHETDLKEVQQVSADSLNGYDLVGMFDQFVPKFAKQYTSVAPDIQNAYQVFTDDVRSGVYPAREQCFLGGREIRELYPPD